METSLLCRRSVSLFVTSCSRAVKSRDVTVRVVSMCEESSLRAICGEDILLRLAVLCKLKQDS